MKTTVCCLKSIKIFTQLLNIVSTWFSPVLRFCDRFITMSICEAENVCAFAASISVSTRKCMFTWHHNVLGCTHCHDCMYFRRIITDHFNLTYLFQVVGVPGCCSPIWIFWSDRAKAKHIYHPHNLQPFTLLISFLVYSWMKLGLCVAVS